MIAETLHPVPEFITVAGVSAGFSWDSLTDAQRHALVAKLRLLRGLPRAQWEQHGLEFYEPPRDNWVIVPFDPELRALVRLNPDHTFIVDGFVTQATLDRFADEGEAGGQP